MPLTKNPPVSPWWRITHAASDTAVRSIQQGFTRAVNAIEVDSKLLRDEIARGRYARAADAFDWRAFERDLAKQLETRTMKAAKKAAEETAERLGIEPPSLEDIQQGVRARSRAVARQMARDSRDAVKASARRVREELGRSSAQTASRMKQIAGLNKRQAAGIVNREAALLGEGASPFKRDAAVKSLAKANRRNRAILVARHEGLNAAEDAQEAAIRAGVDSGAISQVFQRWVSVVDKLRDPICKRLHGQRVRLGESFTDPATLIRYTKPPEPHGLCRCGRQYSFRKVARRRAA